MSDEENKVNDSKNSEEWEYEYVEIPEGEELLETDEYEYFEVPEEEVISSSVTGDNQVKTLSEDSLNINSANIAAEEIEVEEIDMDEFVSRPNEDDIEVVEVIDNTISVEEVIEIPYEDDIEVVEAIDDTISMDEVIEIPYEDDVEIVEAIDDTISMDEVIEVPYEDDVEIVESFTTPLAATKVEEYPIEEEPIITQYEEENSTLLDQNLTDFEHINAQVSNVSTTEYKNAISNAKIFTKLGGIDVFQGSSTKDTILIDDINYKENELSGWKLIIFDKKIIQLPNDGEIKKIPLLKNSVRLAKLLNHEEEKVGFFNDEEFKTIPHDNEFGIIDGKFIFGNTDNSKLHINDFINISLVKYKGKKISFVESVSGMIIGVNASILYFANVKNIIIPYISYEENSNLSDDNISWYSGNIDNNYINISSASTITSIVGTPALSSIHLDIGASSYGWNVSFDNGVIMSARDLQIYQCKNGSLPSNNGIISYGSKKLEFKNIRRIVIYEVPQYAAYGK